MSITVCKQCNAGKIPLLAAVFISYGISAAALTIPFAVSVGGNVATPLSKDIFDLSPTSILILLVWLISGFVHGNENHNGYLICAINSLGVPGLLTTVITSNELLKNYGG